MTDDHDAQNQRQISAQMGRTVCDRDSLFKRSISPYDFRWRLSHDANQRQVFKEVLSLIGSFSSRPSDQGLAEFTPTHLQSEHPGEESRYLK